VTTSLTLRFGEMICPHCGKRLDQHDDLKGSYPKHGDVSLCIECGRLSIFDAHEKCLRMPSTPELREFEQDPEVQRYQAAWRHVVRKTPQ
jgi:hypothetical protein